MKKMLLITLAVAGLALAGCVQQVPSQNQNAGQPTANINQNLNQPAVNQNINQQTPPPTATPTDQTTGVTENAVGIIKSVYNQSGKNYLDIDYIELNPNWAPGGMSEQPAYQNNNPKIRTFEISPSAKIAVRHPDRDLTFSEFQNFFSPSSGSYQKSNPWDIVIVDGVITDITGYSGNYLP